LNLKTCLCIFGLLSFALSMSGCSSETSFSVAAQPTIHGDSPAPDSIWAWGFNPDYSKISVIGEPLRGTFITTPTRIEALNNVNSIAVCADENLALMANGTVWTWVGAGIEYDYPKRVSGLDGIIAVAPGITHFLALRWDGTVWGWGSNGTGQLGDGTRISREIPVQVKGLSNIVKIAVGSDFSVALGRDGTVWTWGWISTEGDPYIQGESITKTLEPKTVAAASQIVEIAAGYRYRLILRADGTVWAWGENVYGEIGDNSKMDRWNPTRVHGISGVVSISAPPNGHKNLILKSDGTVWEWGAGVAAIPRQVPNLDNISAIGSGGSHSLALKKDGSVWAWGDNSQGQLGDGTLIERTTPVEVRQLAGVRTIAAGNHNLALK
jgi:alpha-tubulin suppressor-like RCC1 family protein